MNKPKEKGELEVLALTKGISRMYRALTLLEAQLSEWKPEAERLKSKHERTGDPHDLEAFAIHVSGALAQVRETLRKVGQ